MEDSRFSANEKVLTRREARPFAAESDEHQQPRTPGGPGLLRSVTPVRALAGAAGLPLTGDLQTQREVDVVARGVENGDSLWVDAR
jgi:hypothetical protein